MNNLIEHTLNKTGYVEVMDAVLYNIVTNTPVLILDTLKISNISGEGQKKEIKGGIKAPVLAEYAYGRTVNIEFQDAVASLNSLQEIWGGVLNADNVDGHYRFVTSTDASGKILLTDAVLVRELRGGVIKSAVGYDDAGKEYAGTVGADGITFEGVSAITKLHVLGQATYSKGEGKYTPVELVIKSDTFPKAVKLVGNTVGIDIRTGQQVLVEIEIPKLSITPSNNMTLESEGDATVFDFAGTALLNEDKTLFKIKHLAWLEEQQ